VVSNRKFYTDQQHPPLLRPSYSHARIPLQSNTSSLTHPAAVPKEYDYEVAKYLREKLHTEATIKLTEGETEIARITVRTPVSSLHLPACALHV